MNKSQVLSNKPMVKAHPKTGAIVTYFENSKGETFGKIRVDQRAATINNGFMSFTNRSAFITLNEEDAKAMETIVIVDTPYPIEGKVVITESTDPFYEGQTPKTKGVGGAIITHLGAPVYRNTNYVFDLNAKDTLLVSDRDGVSITETAESLAEFSEQVIEKELVM
jgi:hypothetical protein